MRDLRATDSIALDAALLHTEQGHGEQGHATEQGHGEQGHATEQGHGAHGTAGTARKRKASGPIDKKRHKVPTDWGRRMTRGEAVPRPAPQMARHKTSRCSRGVVGPEASGTARGNELPKAVLEIAQWHAHDALHTLQRWPAMHRDQNGLPCPADYQLPPLLSVAARQPLGDKANKRHAHACCPFARHCTLHTYSVSVQSPAVPEQPCFHAQTWAALSRPMSFSFLFGPGCLV
ncbi:hypothetical protein CDD82_3315 [Ophiocordyceps australis]|uniref:Uncharacterized protein n=1 Tax=Ophiocordyceps australis TaxID=1399860 RepID=A0A2C5ZFC0_9HYPO|nr:hypothetical protein CDD82_3315 [Ophiocordyceps australis]